MLVDNKKKWAGWAAAAAGATSVMVAGMPTPAHADYNIGGSTWSWGGNPQVNTCSAGYGCVNVVVFMSETVHVDWSDFRQIQCDRITAKGSSQLNPYNSSNANFQGFFISDHWNTGVFGISGVSVAYPAQAGVGFGQQGQDVYWQSEVAGTKARHDYSSQPMVFTLQNSYTAGFFSYNRDVGGAVKFTDGVYASVGTKSWNSTLC